MLDQLVLTINFSVAYYSETTLVATRLLDNGIGYFETCILVPCCVNTAEWHRGGSFYVLSCRLVGMEIANCSLMGTPLLRSYTFLPSKCFQSRSLQKKNQVLPGTQHLKSLKTSVERSVP
jgi:hypothetical protein